MNNDDKNIKNLTLPGTVIPVIALAIMLAASIGIYGENATSGPAQIALIIAGCVAGGFGVRRGVSWKELEKAVAATVADASVAMLILLTIGGLIGVWMAAGVIPTLIVYGGQLISLQFFYPSALVISAITALVIGSSWTTAGTIGAALIAIAAASGLSLPITAGAIISGVYFGDKMSPLSDTTNLASGMAGVDIFDHIRYLTWTTLPSFLIALLFFFAIGTSGEVAQQAAQFDALAEALTGSFAISLMLLIPLLCIFMLAFFRVPSLITIIASIFVGALCGWFIQPEGIDQNALTTYWSAAASGYSIDTGMAMADELVSRGGMDSMLTTIWLILSAMFFSGMMERSGSLRHIVMLLLSRSKAGRQMLLYVGGTSMATNTIASDQYLSIVLSVRMYTEQIAKSRLHPVTLSRTVEDFGTVTSPLIPWNTCGAFMAATLGVPTLAYIPYCIFCLVSPVISSGFILSGATIRYKNSGSTGANQD